MTIKLDKDLIGILTWILCYLSNAFAFSYYYFGFGNLFYLFTQKSWLGFNSPFTMEHITFISACLIGLPLLFIWAILGMFIGILLTKRLHTKELEE